MLDRVFKSSRWTERYRNFLQRTEDFGFRCLGTNGRRQIGPVVSSAPRSTCSALDDMLVLSNDSSGVNVCDGSRQIIRQRRGTDFFLEFVDLSGQGRNRFSRTATFRASNSMHLSRRCRNTQGTSTSPQTAVGKQYGSRCRLHLDCNVAIDVDSESTVSRSALPDTVPCNAVTDEDSASTAA